jgi:hypothetical protein
MGLLRFTKVRDSGIEFRSGYIYTFKYANYENDPEPTIICINGIKGIHDRTGHRHNYIQAINFTYIPRRLRRQFVQVWLKLMDQTNGHVMLTWKMVERRWPWMKVAIRRYTMGQGYIQHPKEIPFMDIEQAVVGSWGKDFSIKSVKAYIKGLKKFR